MAYCFRISYCSVPGIYSFVNVEGYCAYSTWYGHCRVGGCYLWWAMGVACDGGHARAAPCWVCLCETNHLVMVRTELLGEQM